MSGHSKWAQIKRKKAVTDAKKGAVFTRFAKNISLAAKNGKDPEMNPALRGAIDQAKEVNMPKDNIEKAILKGAGELPGVVYQEEIYEAYGPGGAAILIVCVTDNTNRTVSNMRSIFTDHGGALGESGSVMYMFTQKGMICLANEDIAQHNAEEIELSAIEAGACDIQTEAEGLTIVTAKQNFHKIFKFLKDKGITPTQAQIEWTTEQKTTPAPEYQEKLKTLIAALEDNDDVNDVYTNIAW
ncbi:MAG: hypothetical protein A2233_01065 [Candidatus Kerfeldbacteria bacterium RIFOXYA2_FULL_38_24]|uniref:Probable transcriptional regulatory protein A2319_02055 n=1 Tax=Candidatus Kerfeldbacteria bacterium RIFOXYB2_FULL_38_14 TaxID=1798547 RepID=A0A1G2BEA3_9BACT|nr:MAG: hypothetical protein A2233_01065 [Candidatus Kerfeldbacteria bacterium RIFOXYA2_FULL_38_24]OGY86527.1 MAG: hypothetical protein A2319_02055 [Candidatus Kerfeldbacteria bacterium RIFOXYB2_FULL_38_14]OGY89268.1 MAG: hypothetical protein A2458_00825 [Candidatus Kerfeldbacteria bacterium RIFOXYC2_FULL_38_9]